MKLIYKNLTFVSSLNRPSTVHGNDKYKWKKLFCHSVFYPFPSHDDIRLESRRQLYKPVKEAKDGTPTYQVPPFTAVVKYVMERVDALPRRKWLDVANQPVPFSVPIMEQVSHLLMEGNPCHLQTFLSAHVYFTFQKCLTFSVDFHSIFC